MNALIARAAFVATSVTLAQAQTVHVLAGCVIDVAGGYGKIAKAQLSRFGAKA
jgi:hypothetical protein